MTRARIVIGTGLAVLAAMWLGMQYFVWEPSSIPRGSLYALKVPAAAKNQHVWNAVGTPLYDVRLGDRPSPAYTLVRYAASGGTERLERAIAADGFDCQRIEPGSISCDRRRDGALDMQVVAQYEFAADASRVTVHIPQY
ncbi:MAG TPA: hypothetical protein VJV78_01625 [Polyangiales bacterium]|nr:hypothetical protein [Polyangiales bacterium]